MYTCTYVHITQCAPLLGGGGAPRGPHPPGQRACGRRPAELRRQRPSRRGRVHPCYCLG